MASGLVESGAWVCWVVGNDTAKRRGGEGFRKPIRNPSQPMRGSPREVCILSMIRI
jgi:hypothetical protein